MPLSFSHAPIRESTLSDEPVCLFGIKNKLVGCGNNLIFYPSGTIDTVIKLCYDSVINQAITLITARARLEVHP